jgi:hypothetical protein
MKRNAYPYSIVSIAFALLCIANLSPAAGPARGIRWAGKVDVTGSGRVNILHAPDNQYTPVDPALTVSEFGPAMAYPDLSRLLAGVAASDLARADVIAFEGNGGHGAGVENGWESSHWTFSDGATSRAVAFNECLGARGSDPRVIATGSIRGADGRFTSGGAAYSAFFGLCSPDPRNLVVSYILFDLHSIRPAINISSPSFAIKIENFHTGAPGSPGDCERGHSGEGTPDPDAVGILSTCPRR